MLTISLIKAFLWVIRFALTVYAAYFVSISLFSFRRKPLFPAHSPEKRFAVIVPARNEAAVIGHLIESLLHQDYPRELFDIFVIPNNCSDNTREVAESAGAKILECTIPIHSKGEVLAYILPLLMDPPASADAAPPYDAFLFFDADNLAHPGFLAAMNNAACTGVRAAQGYRDSKNPGDTIISGCTSIYYWTINRFLNRAKSAVGLSAMINGTGFMVAVSLLRDLGGWHTVTMGEDNEFSTLCAFRGEKVAWVPEARTYDEQPLTFKESWQQRKRWSSGVIQGLSLYGWRLFRASFKPRGILCFDQWMNCISPVMQVLYVFSVLIQFGLEWFPVRSFVFPGDDTFYRAFLSAPGSYMFTTLLAIVVVLVEHRSLHRVVKGILAYGLYIFSWIPINFMCLIKTDGEWREVRHTRSMSIHELAPSVKNQKPPVVPKEIESGGDGE